VIVAVLVGIGFLFLNSSTMETERARLMQRQLKTLWVTIPALLVFSLLPMRFLARTAFTFYLIVLILLGVVLAAGVELNHARRWMALPGGFTLQPSELCKPALILALARYLEFRDAPERGRDLVGPILLTLVPFYLVYAEPDLGTALTYLPVAAAMLWVARARKLFFVTGLVLLLVLVPVMWFTPLLHDYQKERIATYLTSIPSLEAKAKEAKSAGAIDRARDLAQQARELRRGRGSQAYSALVAVGSGGVLGKGLGQGPQNRLDYLPERHGDFVFAVIAEEWGFRGGTLVVVLYLLLMGSLLAIALASKDHFGRLVATGVATCITTQAWINIGVTTGLLPTKGLPLPLISHGGSSMLSSLILIGLAISVARDGNRGDPFLYPAPRPQDPFCLKEAQTRL